MNWGLFFGSLIVVYLISYFVGYDEGWKDAKEVMKETEFRNSCPFCGERMHGKEEK